MKISLSQLYEKNSPPRYVIIRIKCNKLWRKLWPLPASNFTQEPIMMILFLWYYLWILLMVITALQREKFKPIYFYNIPFYRDTKQILRKNRKKWVNFTVYWTFCYILMLKIESSESWEIFSISIYLCIQEILLQRWDWLCCL